MANDTGTRYLRGREGDGVVEAVDPDGPTGRGTREGQGHQGRQRLPPVHVGDPERVRSTRGIRREKRPIDEGDPK